MNIEEEIRRVNSELRELIDATGGRMKDLEMAVVKMQGPGADFSSLSHGRSSPETKAWGTFLRKGEGACGPDERKTLIVGDATLGGYLAPVQVATELIKGITEFSPIRQIARVIQINRESIDIPRRSASGAAAWTTETGTRTETVGLGFGMEHLTPYECYYLAKVSQKLLEDNAYGLENELMIEFAEQFGKLTGAGYVNGDGVGKPEGVHTRVADGTIAHIPSGIAAAISAEGVMGLPFQISTAYWPNARFLMSRATLWALRLLKDPVSGLYLFAGAADKTPDRICGFPYTLVEDLEGEGAGHFPIIFGDFSKGYLICDRVQMQVQRLAEKYAEVGQVGFLARMRTTGQVVLPAALVALECATT